MSEPFKPLTETQIEMLRQGLINSEWCGFSKRATVHAVCDMALASLSLPSPCGHPSQYAYTEDGGAHMVCLLCERSAPTEGNALQWQPIETAPHDGPPLLLSCPEQLPVVGWWIEKEGSWMLASFMNRQYVGYMGGRSWLDPQPTHWMSLPSLPSPQKEST
jgi:hypothetical protein